MMTDADNFAVSFPTEATGEDRALLLCAAIFFDYWYNYYLL